MKDKTDYKILVVFLGREDMPAGWPYSRFPVNNQIEKIKKEINQISKNLDTKFDFFGWKLIQNDSDIYESYSLMDEADGLVIVPLNAEFASLGPDIFKLCEKNLPTIIYTKPFSVYYDGYAALKANGVKAILAASSDPNDLIEPLTIVKTAVDLKRLNLLIVRDLEHDYTKIDPRMLDPRWKGPAYSDLIKKYFGSSLVYAGSRELLAHYNEIADAHVQEEFDKAIHSAAEIKEPPEDDIFKAVKMYLAIKSLMNQKNANGFTVDCLSYIREKTMPISPCFAISKSNDEGMVAGCEADVESVLTIAICHYLTGKPGFQADPVIDRRKNQVIFAHCTAPTRMGIDTCYPCRFRTHNESLSDVGLEIEMKTNEPVTILKLIGTGTITYMGLPQIPVQNTFETYHILTHEATTVEHDYTGSPWGCRTKLAIELRPDELEKFENNFFGFHRVIVYGSYQKKLKSLAQLLGVKFHDTMYLPVSD